MVKQKTGNMKNRKEKLKNTPKLKEASYTVCLDKDFLIEVRGLEHWSNFIPCQQPILNFFSQV